MIHFDRHQYIWERQYTHKDTESDSCRLQVCSFCLESDLTKTSLNLIRTLESDLTKISLNLIRTLDSLTPIKGCWRALLFQFQ